MPHGNISPNFNDQVEALSSTLQGSGNAAVAPVQRGWQSPPAVAGVGAWDGNPFTIDGDESIGVPFYRTDLNKAYIAAITSSGGTGGGRVVDRMTTKIQVDYLAAMERAFRARHASSVRCTAHAAARLKMSGAFRNTRDYLKELLAQGHKD